MKIPVHIIREKKRREELDRRREEGRRIPIEIPVAQVRRDRPLEKNSKHKVIVIQM